MTSLRRAFTDELDRIAAGLRVAVLEDTAAADRLAGARSIVSGLPAVRLYQPPAGHVARRRRVHLAGPEGRVTLLTSLRDGLFAPGPELAAVRWARVGRDGNGERRPVAWADPATRSVQLALRPHAAELVEAATGRRDPRAVAARYLLRAPLEALLRRDRGPVIGDDVPATARALMDSGRACRSRLVSDELQLIEHWARSEQRPGDLPASLQRRAGRLRRWLRGHARRGERVTSEQASVEVERLTRLVTSRACSGLVLAADGISGLLNPRVCRRGRRHGAFFFRLELRTGPGDLELWDAGAVRGRGAVQCLGDGEIVLRQALERADVYGMVDMILNYVESNLVRTAPDRLHATFIREDPGIARAF